MMKQAEQRKYWVETMTRIAGPVMEAVSQGKLKERMPVEQRDDDRRHFAHLEAFGRTMCGIAPWIQQELPEGEEEQLRRRYEAMAVQGLLAATDPDSPDFMNFNQQAQPLVDTAFLSHALIRAPRLIAALTEQQKQQVIRAFRSSRCIVPGPSNWILFSAMVETALCALGAEDYDMLRVKSALRQFMQWYKGDGVYGDGADFHADYYNSFVIAPMLTDISGYFADRDEEIAAMRPVILKRASRYAALLERMISPEGYYPIVGRSIAYRFGAFQMLSQAALQHLLPEEVAPAQVRCGLTAVMQKIMDAPGMFDAEGWLRPGVYGYQPGLGESYICTGSLYLCCAVFLALGLSPEDPFWAGENASWTAKKVADGENLECDHSIAG